MFKRFNEARVPFARHPEGRSACAPSLCCFSLTMLRHRLRRSAARESTIASVTDHGGSRDGFSIVLHHRIGGEIDILPQRQQFENLSELAGLLQNGASPLLDFGIHLLEFGQIDIGHCFSFIVVSLRGAIVQTQQSTISSRPRAVIQGAKSPKIRSVTILACASVTSLPRLIR